MTRIQLKRVYDDPAGDPASDGFRIFIDRLWPRGESKLKFHYDLWVKDLAPSTELREWFHADPLGRWPQFQEKYLAELRANPSAQDLARRVASMPLVTLLYSSRDTEHNNAVVLRRFLQPEG